MEENVFSGGYGQAVGAYLMEAGMETEFLPIAITDQFVEHGSTQELYQLLKLDKEGICESLLQALEL